MLHIKNTSNHKYLWLPKRGKFSFLLFWLSKYVGSLVNVLLNNINDSSTNKNSAMPSGRIETQAANPAAEINFKLRLFEIRHLNDAVSRNAKNIVSNPDDAGTPMMGDSAIVRPAINAALRPMQMRRHRSNTISVIPTSDNVPSTLSASITSDVVFNRNQ